MDLEAYAQIDDLEQVMQNFEFDDGKLKNYRLD